MLLWIVLALGALYWLASAVLVDGSVRHMRRLPELQPPEPAEWPRLSLIVPACNEEETLGQALRSRLADDYPNLEVIVVDDRSTDGTLAVAQRVAAEDARVRVVHVDELPPGWLGKLHAMAVGADAATSDADAGAEWLLFTDADVHFTPGTLRRAVAWCEARRLDHLGVLPSFNVGSLWLGAVYATFVRMIGTMARPRAVEDPRSAAAFGVGAFNLVRRRVLEDSPGLAWLRMEVCDDVALGQMLKRAGARCSLALGDSSVSLEFYRSLGDMARGMEKNSFAALGRFSYVRFLGSALFFMTVELAPLVGLALGDGVQRLAAAVLLALALATCVRTSRWLRRPLLPALLFPLGTTLFIAFALRSVALTAWRGGISWRGTLYPLGELRQGMRLRFP